jgi:hypothetical protein
MLSTSRDKKRIVQNASDDAASNTCQSLPFGANAALGLTIASIQAGS